MFTVQVIHICLLLNATTLLILIVAVLTVMMLLSTVVSLCQLTKFNKNNMWRACMTILSDASILKLL